MHSLGIISDLTVIIFHLLVFPMFLLEYLSIQKLKLAFKKYIEQFCGTSSLEDLLSSDLLCVTWSKLKAAENSFRVRSSWLLKNSR